MRGILIVSAMLVLGSGAIFAPLEPAYAQDTPLPAGGCPYLPAYGTVYDTDGNEVTGDATTRPDLLAQALGCAEKHLDLAETAQYQAAVGAVISDVPDPQTRAARLLLRAELAAAISSNATVRQQDEVARRLAGHLDDGAVVALAKQNGALELLVANGWKGFDASSVPPDRQGDYTAQCQAAGVPVPPPINVGPGWSGPQVLSYSRADWVLSSPSPVVWTYRDDQGFCVALRRGDASIVALGTICSNQSQTRACFFDSFVYDKGVATALSEDEALTTKYTELIHPADIKNRCDGCHVGANPFIVNPHAPLGQLVRNLYTDDPTRFDFVGTSSPRWWNPPFFSAASPADETCVRCHDLPGADTGAYCDRILHLSGGWFMPPRWPDDPHWAMVDLWPVGKDGCPADPDNVPVPLQKYVQSVHALAQMCRPGEQIPDCPAFKGSSSPP